MSRWRNYDMHIHMYTVDYNLVFQKVMLLVAILVNQKEIKLSEMKWSRHGKKPTTWSHLYVESEKVEYIELSHS